MKRLILDLQQLEIGMKRIALKMSNSDGEMKKHAIELYGASEVLHTWIDGIEKETENVHRSIQGEVQETTR